MKSTTESKIDDVKVENQSSAPKEQFIWKHNIIPSCIVLVSTLISLFILFERGFEFPYLSQFHNDDTVQDVSVYDEYDYFIDTRPKNDVKEEVDEVNPNLIIPEGSVYSYKYNHVSYIKDGQYVPLDKLNIAKAEYINEDFIKDDRYVFYRGDIIAGVNPTECTAENPKMCEPAWMREKLSPYALSITWNDDTYKNFLEANAQDEDDSYDYCKSPIFPAGMINNGYLNGAILLMQIDDSQGCGMWCSNTTPPSEVAFYVAYKGGHLPVDELTGFSIPEIDKFADQSRIKVSNGNYYLTGGGIAGMFNESPDNRGLKWLFKDPVVGDVYKDKNDCFVAKRIDGMRMVYGLELPFVQDGSITIRNQNGTPITESYSLRSDYGACFNEVKDPAELLQSITPVGVFTNAEVAYIYKDPQHKKLQELYNNKNTLASYRDGANKYTYNEFLAYNPYLYWKSPFGDWIEMLNRRFETAAEKCKPVIYLYPEETGKFSVTVEPNGGFTKTIPEYNNGWFVESTPDSKITDLSSGLEYPYLYWEGVNTGIPEIEKGWIVPIGHIEPFLVDALTRLGLNENEIADFNEYWIARLEKEGHKEYKIMFLEQEKFEELAPLSVDGDEKPASTIRVMMYAQGALPNESLSLQILPPTPARVGFTVVEWGGALLNQ